MDCLYMGWLYMGWGRLWAVLLFMAISSGAVPLARAQQETPPPEGAHQQLEPVPGLRRNSIASFTTLDAALEARGDSLWIGPCLDLTTDGGASFQRIATDRLCGSSPNRLFSLDIEGDVLWAGLGRPTAGENVNAASGFLVSRDGGETVAYRFPQTDVDSSATTVSYGVNTGPLALPALVIREQNAAPTAVDYVDSTGALWVAGRGSGLRRSIDGGETFERLVLPPDSLDAISPTQFYNFPLQPEINGVGSANHVVNSVLVDETGTVWAGTLAGVNRSRPEDVVSFEGPDTTFTERAWRHFDFENTSGATGGGLTGDVTINIAEQPQPGRNPVWMVTLPSGLEEEERGVTVTRDGGQTFEQTLLGESIFDFAFRSDTVYAAGARGLFISDDGGSSWRLLRGFPGADRPESTLPSNLPVYAVETTDDALWAGTEDGLFKSTDGGRSWEVFRAQVPLHPDEPTEQNPGAETYAYPNPFSPAAAPSGVTRIVVEVEEPRTVTVRLYDFGMTFVRALSEECQPGVNCEIAWDGTDTDGLRVANGVYFYEADTGEERVRGKIMVLE